MSGGTSGAFIFLYCFFYFHVYSDMSGLLQVTPATGLRETMLLPRTCCLSV